MKGEWIKQKLKKVLIILCIVMLLFNFITPNYSHAIGIGDILGLGGSILRGVTTTLIITKLPELITWFFDWIYMIMEKILIPEVGFGDVWVYKENGNGGNSFEEIIDIIRKEKRGKDTAEGASSEIWEDNPYYATSAPSSYTEIEFDEDTIGLWGLGGFNIPWTIISPLDIFKCTFPLLNANYFDGVADASESNILRDNVANWYNTFRIIAILGLLCVLLYLGIRIIISTTVSDKSKYKNMLVDWIVALCLIFCLHYIMSFTMNMVDYLCDILASDSSDIYSLRIYNINPEMYVPTNLVGVLRIRAAQDRYEDSNDWMHQLINVAIYGAMVILMVTFTITYMKRFFTLTFLTFISPLVALTYPLDKAGDGKAQAFNFWLKEYISNAMLPIIHIILYRVLIMSVPDLVTEEPLYALCAFAFFNPAKKIIDSMFFVRLKGQTGAPPSITGAAIAGNAFNKISGEASKIMGNFGNVNNKGGSSGDGSDKLKQQKGSGIFETEAVSSNLPSSTSRTSQPTGAGSQTSEPTGAPANQVDAVQQEGSNGYFDNFENSAEYTDGTHNSITSGSETPSQRTIGEADGSTVDTRTLTNEQRQNLMDTADRGGTEGEEALAVIRQNAASGDRESIAYLRGRGDEIPTSENLNSTDNGGVLLENTSTNPENPQATSDATEADSQNLGGNSWTIQTLNTDNVTENDSEKKKLRNRVGELIKTDLGIPEGSPGHVAKTLVIQGGKYLAIQGLGKVGSIGTALAFAAAGATVGLAKGAGKSEGIEGILNETETGAWGGLSMGTGAGRALEANWKNVSGHVADNGLASLKYIAKGGNQYAAWGKSNLDLDDVRKSQAFKRDEKIYKTARKRVIAERKQAGKGIDSHSDRTAIANETKEKIAEWDLYRIKAGGKITTDELKRLDDIKLAREAALKKSAETRNNMLPASERKTDIQIEREAKIEAIKYTGNIESYKKESGISASTLYNTKKRMELEKSLKERFHNSQTNKMNQELKKIAQGEGDYAGYNNAQKQQASERIRNRYNPDVNSAYSTAEMLTALDHLYGNDV